MYINKNKGITIIETLVSFLLIAVFFQGVYIFSKSLSKSKNLDYKEMSVRNEVDIYMYKIQKRMKESYRYEILDRNEIDYFLNLNGVNSGNILVIEEYNKEKYPIKEFLGKIYIFKNKRLEVYQGKKSGENMYIDKNTLEILQENIEGNFEKTPFGIKIRCKKGEVEIVYEIFK